MRFLLLLFVLSFSVYAGHRFPSLCDICVGLIDTIQQALDHGEDVKTAVHKFCANDVPDVLVNACEKIVANSLDFIVDQLKEHKPEKEICESIHLC